MELYPHQQTALEETRQYNRVAYYLDMGLGKTFVGSEKMRELNSPVNLIVCQKSKVEDWEKHMIENYAMDHCWIIYNLTDKKDFERFFKEVKTRKSGDPTVCGVINYDLLFRRAEIAHLTGFTLMLDESSIIQNEGTKRSKFVLGLHPDNVILLSGTPTAGKYEKLWSQLHLLGWGISKDLFYKQYVTTEWMEDSQSGFRIKVVTGYKNVDRLKAKLAQHGAVFMKSEDVFTLPEQSFISVTSKIPGCYKKFMRDDVITIDGREYVGDTTLSKRIYARMMCSFLNRERVAAFVDLVHFDVLDDIVWEWEQRTGMRMDFDTYFGTIYQKDVNNYLLVDRETGAVKRKGGYVMKLDDLSYDLPIINKALVDYMIHQIPVRRTISECQDLREFQLVSRISSKYTHIMYGDKPLKERCIRIFASTDPNDPGVKKVKASNGRLEKLQNSPEHCFIYNDDVKDVRVPDKLDRQWYINFANKRLEDFGVS